MRKESLNCLITGASSGFGACFARRLAASGHRLILVARREERLRELAGELNKQHGVEVQVETRDLTQSGACRRLFEKTEGAGRPVDVLINNAGSAAYGSFADVSWKRHQAQIDLNVTALTELSHLYAKAMRERGHGYLLNVTSFVALLPIPRYASYAATKSYVHSFSRALRKEMRPHGIQVCSLCSGASNTEFYRVAGQESLPRIVRWTMVRPDAVARVGLKALFAGKPIAWAPWYQRLGAFALCMVPDRMQVWLAHRAMS